jgi:hypothetical protein
MSCRRRVIRVVSAVHPKSLVHARPEFLASGGLNAKDHRYRRPTSELRFMAASSLANSPSISVVQ